MSKTSDDLKYERPTTKKIILYSLNAFYGIILFSLWGQIQFFAASLLLIPITIIPIIYFFYSFIDGLNDPIIGYLCDRSTRFTAKYGKRYPWILLGMIIAPITVILFFVQIAEIKVDASGTVLNPEAVVLSTIWLTFVMVIYETLQTISEINYAALTPDMFRTMEDRTRQAGIGMFLAVLGTIASALLIPLIIASLGGATSINAYIGTALIIAIISYIFTIPFSRGIRESEQMKEKRTKLDEKEKDKFDVIEIVKRVFKDKNWMAVVIGFLCWAVAASCFNSGLNFYVIHVLGLGIEATTLPTLLLSVVAIISIPIWVKLPKRIGAKKSYLLCFLSLAGTSFAFFFVTNYITLLIIFASMGLTYASGWGVIFSIIQSEAIDNSALQSGRRDEGSYFGILRIFSAFSYFFQTLIYAIVGSTTGYNPAFGTNQSDLAKFGIKFQMSIIPMIIMIIAIIIFYYMYNISKEDAIDNKEKLLEMGI